ncbi:hypothetical protein E2C01_003300 [Portunus trituberculatus]|uniref:Uncharacterized protein n=1 Tax=Portunus trituberculatus TaxID=210409 RepID=A0A5B7CPF3_PORTR|nr:hypothetical protein [Portunus trituberculatus]
MMQSLLFWSQHARNTKRRGTQQTAMLLRIYSAGSSVLWVERESDATSLYHGTNLTEPFSSVSRAEGAAAARPSHTPTTCLPHVPHSLSQQTNHLTADGVTSRRTYAATTHTRLLLPLFLLRTSLVHEIPERPLRSSVLRM